MAVITVTFGLNYDSDASSTGTNISFAYQVKGGNPWVSPQGTYADCTTYPTTMNSNPARPDPNEIYAQIPLDTSVAGSYPYVLVYGTLLPPGPGPGPGCWFGGEVDCKGTGVADTYNVTGTDITF